MPLAAAINPPAPSTSTPNSTQTRSSCHQATTVITLSRTVPISTTPSLNHFIQPVSTAKVSTTSGPTAHIPMATPILRISPRTLHSPLYPTANCHQLQPSPISGCRIRGAHRRSVSQSIPASFISALWRDGNLLLAQIYTSLSHSLDPLLQFIEAVDNLVKMSLIVPLFVAFRLDRFVERNEPEIIWLICGTSWGEEEQSARPFAVELGLMALLSSPVDPPGLIPLRSDWRGAEYQHLANLSLNLSCLSSALRPACKQTSKSQNLFFCPHDRITGTKGTPTGDIRIPQRRQYWSLWEKISTCPSVVVEGKIWICRISAIMQIQFSEGKFPSQMTPVWPLSYVFHSAVVSSAYRWEAQVQQDEKSGASRWWIATLIVSDSGDL